MASFIMKQMVGDKIGEISKLGGGDEGASGQSADPEADAELEQARQEQEERRKDKHRKLEEDREKMRQNIRDKYNIQKKEEMPDPFAMMDCEGRVGTSKRKSPEELQAEIDRLNDDSLSGQLNSMVDKAKDAIESASETMKSLLPFGN